jgi:hypothetical protein
MPLQIRRGTDAERLQMAQPLAQGELLYVTDDQRLYIGNGSTLGGVQITGYRDEDAQDAAAAIFTNGIHTGINFVYDDLNDRINATINLVNYTGAIGAASFKGTVVGDDSTILVDGVSNRVNLDGTVKGNIVPDTNIAYDLGSASNRFRDLYLSGSSIKLGDATITATGTAVNLPAGSTVNGIPLELSGESSLNVDINGSVFAADSGVVVDSVDRIFFGSVDAGNTVLTDGSLIGTNFTLGSIDNSMNLTMNLDNNLQVRQVADAINGKFISMNLSRGTLVSPTAVQAGDELGGILVRAYTDSSTSAIAGAFGFVVDSTATIAGGSFVKSKAIISAATDTSQDLVNSLILDSAGAATSNAFIATKYHQLAVYANDAARSSAIPTPVQGMMVFMQSGTVPTVTNKTVVYDGSAWTTV